MNKSEVEYKALRYESAKMVSQMAMDIKAARVLVEQVDVQKLGKRVRKFRCPPGTNRAGKWTNSMGTTCELGAVRANLAKLGAAVERVAIGDGGKPKAPKAKRKKEKRTILGGVGKKLVGTADELATVEELEEALKDKKKGKKRSLLGRKLTDAADVVATEDEIEEALKEALALKKKKQKDKTPDKAPKDSLGILAGRKEVKKLRATVPGDASDEDRKAYDDYLKESFRDKMKDGGKGLPDDLLPFDKWVDADKPERQNVPEKPETPKKPKAPTGGGKKPDADTPEAIKPVADEDLPDFEMPSKVPAKKPAGITTMAEAFEDEKKKRRTERPEGITDDEWKRYRAFVDSQKPTQSFGGPAQYPSIPEYWKWDGRKIKNKPGKIIKPGDDENGLTEGNLPTPETTKIPATGKPKKPKKPSGPAAAAEAAIDVAAQKNEKNKGKKPKKLPGKQYGNVFKNEESAKQWGYNTALDRGKEIYVVKTENGKFRLVDKERFLAGDEEAVFAFGPNGSIIDLPDPKADKDEIVLDVENAVDKIPDEEAKEIADLEKLDGKLELTKSKTGLFLPDDLSPEMLDKYNGPGTNEKFISEFSQQREEVLQFWDARLGDKKFDSSEEMLTAIDKLIADEDGKTPKNQKLLGLLRTERKNFAAMWVADKKGDDLDPFERFNYIQPKRRKAIIEGTDIEGLVVGKKDVNEKDKIDLDPTVDLIPDDGKTPDLKPDVDTTPDAGADKPSGSTYVPAAPPKSATEEPKIKPNGSASSPPKKELATEDAKQLVKSEVDWHENYAKNTSSSKFAKEGEQDIQDRIDTAKEKYQSYLDEDPIKEDLLAAKDSKLLLDDEISKLDEKIEKDKLDAQKLAEDGEAEEFEKKMDEIFDSITELEYKKRLSEGLDKKITESEKESVKADDADIADVADTPDALKEWDKLLEQVVLTNESYQDWLDDKEWYEATKNQGFNNLAESPSPAEGDTSWFQTEEEVNKHFDGLIFFMDEQYGFNVSYLEQKQQEGQPITAGDVEYLANIDGMKEYYELKRKEALDGLKKKDVDVAEVDKIVISDNKNASAIQTFFGEEIEGYDHKKLVDAEDSKLGNSLKSIIDRQDSKGKYTTDLPNAIEGLPENFADLSPEEQRKALIIATGAVDDLTAAKILARSAVVNRYGKNTTLKELKSTLDNFDDGKVGEGIDNDIMDARIAASSERLAEAQKAFVSLPNGADPVTALVLQGELNDARVEHLTNLLINHKLLVAQGDVNGVSKNAQILISTKDSLPEKVSGEIGQVFNKGLDVKAATSFPKVPKGMPKPTAFDSTYLGSMQQDGSAIAYKIPIGYNAIFTVEDAAARIGSGSKLSEIPDEFLFDAIKLNTGEGKRFSPLFDKANGFNETVGFVDGLTGKKFIVKLADRNDQEHTQEAAGSVLAQILGQPVTGMRFGSGITQKPLPGHKAELEGKKMGDQRAIVIEHVGNMFDPEKFEILSSPPSVSSGDIDPESLARLMVLDRSMNYFDRTTANVIAVRDKETGKIHLHPIDHGNGFYPFADGKDEVSYGFSKVTKGDNIPLHKYLEGMSEEDRAIFAAALKNATTRYKKADYEKEFTKIADVQGLTDVERERLTKHAKFLEDRKESLDWDKMTTDLFKSLGYDDDQIADLLVSKEIQGFQLEEKNTPTLSNSAKKVGELREHRNTGVKTFYDAGLIEGFKVSAQKIKLTGGSPKGKDGKLVRDADGKKLDIPDGDATSLVFKVRSDAEAKIEAEIADPDGGWTEWRSGHVIPVDVFDLEDMGNFPDSLQQKVPITLDVTKPNNKLNNHGSLVVNTKVSTYIKQNPDGSILLYTKTVTGSNSHKRNGDNRTVRIIVPGDPEEFLSDTQKVTSVMESAGINQHGIPTAEQVREVGLRQAAQLLGGTTDSGSLSEEQLMELIESKGLSPDDIQLTTSIGGDPRIVLNEQATRKIMQSTQYDGFEHRITGSSDWNNPNATTDRIVSIFLTGGLTTTKGRHDHGIVKGGMSSLEDTEVGSSDYMFFYPSVNINSDITGTQKPKGAGGFYFYTPIQMNGNRLDTQVHSSDHYGNLDQRAGIFDSSMSANSSGQIQFLGGTRVSSGIMVVDDGKKEYIVEALKNEGVTEIDGIPVELLVAEQSKKDEQFKQLVEIWTDMGFWWE